MSLRIELLCELRNPGIRYGTSTFCAGSRPPVVVEALAALMESVESLQREARQAGWRITGDGWACPTCARARMVDQGTPRGASRPLLPIPTST